MTPEKLTDEVQRLQVQVDLLVEIVLNLNSSALRNGLDAQRQRQNDSARASASLVSYQWGSPSVLASGDGTR